MKQIVAFECPHCKKVFRTEKRHSCKYNPENKSCFSCKHNVEFDSDYIDNEYSKTVYVNCAKDNDVTLKQLVDCRYNLQCEEYEFCGKFYENEHQKKRDAEFEVGYKNSLKELKGIL